MLTYFHLLCCVQPSNEPVGHLSLTAHLASSVINNPLQLLLLQQQPGTDRSKLPLRVSSLQQQQNTRGDEQFFLPCDVGMKVRPVLAGSDSTQTRLANSYLIVTLWRTGLDCGIAGIPMSCEGVEESDLVSACGHFFGYIAIICRLLYIFAIEIAFCHSIVVCSACYAVKLRYNKLGYI